MEIVAEALGRGMDDNCESSCRLVFGKIGVVTVDELIGSSKEGGDCDET